MKQRNKLALEFVQLYGHKLSKEQKDAMLKLGKGIVNEEMTKAEVIDPLDPSLNIDDFSLETSIRIYPNPARNFLNISLTNVNEDLDYQIFNTIGQSVSKGSLESNREHIIDMSQYQSGIYFVKLSTAYHLLTRKVIKE